MMDVLCSIVILLNFFGSSYAETASFFGASFISVPVEEARSTTDIEFRFMTKRSDALLFLAAGNIDYCLIKLEAGRIKVQINLGAGESRVLSPLGLRLDDLMWHNVSISRKDAELTLTVDNIHTSREKLPGRFFELNIHYGLFIGGQGDFSEIFLGHGDWLRGCISHLKYNDIYPLSRARQRLGMSGAHEVSWNCAQEFQASTSTEISFVEDGAFMSIPNYIQRTGSKWELNVKTGSSEGVLLYSSAGGAHSDFVGVEIISGKIKIIFDKGGGPIEVVNDVLVSDGQWHKVIVNFNPTVAQITVDHTTASVKISHTTTRFFDLDDTIFVGGIELNKRARALLQGLKNADLSLKGCIRNLFISSKPIGLPHAKVTQGLLTHCVWSYPCLNGPCITNASCIPKGVNSFMCLCDSPHCVRHDFQETYSVYSKVSQLQLVELVPLTISEGENSVVSISNINIVLDYAKYGIRDSGVLFSTVPSMLPKHGSLIVEIWKKPGNLQTFTIPDLVKNQVRYVHDGSESIEDIIALDLEFSPKLGYVLPGYIQGQHRFILHVKISPVNDPPTLTLSSNKIFRTAQSTRKTLGVDFLNATDPDSARDDLVYTVLNSGNGVLVHSSMPSTSITTFTQRDVDEGSIIYFSNGSIQGYTKIVFQVTDGFLSSSASSLQVHVAPLSIKKVSNTGVISTLRSSVFITSFNLSVIINSDDPSIIILFKITHPSEFGIIEKSHDLINNVTWNTVNNFTSNDLMMDRIRYRHILGNPLQDMFRFTISIGKTDFPDSYEFRITFKELKLYVLSFNNISLNGSGEIVLSSENILFTTTPVATDSNKIVFTLKKLPNFGSILFNDNRVLLNDNFTQMDINIGLIKYRMHRTAYNNVKDNISFDVAADLCEDKLMFELIFLYKPPDSLPHKYNSTLNTIKVMEGGSTSISSFELTVDVEGIKTIVYEVIDGPHHGVLNLIDPNQNLTLVNVTHFTPSQISSGRIFYVHDDSETSQDIINFIALSNIEDDFMLSGSVKVSITLINDNPPERVVHSVFRVVTGGKRLLTTRNLKYTDRDIDFDVNNLLYIVKNCTVICSSVNHKPLTQFTQGDLENLKVVVIENGHCGNQVLLWITDGTHMTQGILDIRPSPPFIEITNNSHLIVSKGGQANVTTANLYSDTNVDINPENIRYEILTGPAQGKLFLMGGPMPTSFTQGHIERNLLSYKQSSSSSVTQDRIQLKVLADGVSAEGSLGIRIFPTSYWGPFIIINNKSVEVEEFTSVLILRDHIQIKQTDVPPSDITYLVVSGPNGGYLEIEGSEEESMFEDEERGGVRAFDQATIDNGKLYYVQSSSNQTADNITVDVTNGITWLHSLVIKIEVLPSKLTISSNNLTVAEGGSIVLPVNFLYSSIPYYRDKVTEYIVKEGPKHGDIVLISTGKKIIKWTAQQMQSSFLKYIHDGSETTDDEFIVVGHAGEKESEPSPVFISISPINDMPPIVVNRSEIKIWRGGIVVISPLDLAVIDKDTPPENITFLIKSTFSGYVAYLEKKDISIEYFTQLQLNLGLVALVHDGGPQRSTFDVEIIDGINKIGPITVVSQLLEPSITLVKNNRLRIFPHLKKQISNTELMASCTDESREVYFNITEPPKKGKLLRDGQVEKNIQVFTQSDVDNGLILYQHTEFTSEYLSIDSFTFDLSADFTNHLRNNEFYIDITVFSGGLDQFLNTTTFTLAVLEGDKIPVFVNLTGILNFLSLEVGLDKPKLFVQTIIFPKNGNICSESKCNITLLSADALLSGNIYYEHDHSDTTSDFFLLSVLLNPGDVILCNISFVVSVTPVNDQPFKLVTENPFINIAQGQKVLISPNDLYTEDLDTDPKEIIYEIINGPESGSILVDSEVVVKFSQEDINSLNVYFKHLGPLQSTSFYFRVSDGHFPPIYTVFNVHVNKLFLNLTINYSISIQQGTNTALIKSDIFNISSNAETDNIVYNITVLPQHGVICINNSPVMSFGHNDLLLLNVFYKQTDMSAPSDTFQVNAFTKGVNDGPIYTELWLNISVQPLVKYGNFHPVSGTKTKLDLSVLDASLLAKLTESNPTYKILKRPKHGKLKKIIYTTGHKKMTREKDIMKFTHLELINGIIYFIGKRTGETLEDRFPFLLSASSVQPAIGEIKFKISGESTTTFKPPNTSLPGLNSPIGHGGVHMASPNMSDDYLLGVSMVTSIVALALLIVGFARCGSKQSMQNMSYKAELPDPLPKPPEELLSTTPYDITPKKEPLIPVVSDAKRDGDLVASSESELNSHYPYGDGEWSSVDSSDVAYSKGNNNPMLRRNQYWV